MRQTTRSLTVNTSAAPAYDVAMEDARTQNDSKGAGRDGPLLRLAHEIRSLVDDIKEWVELRIELLQLDVEKRVQDVANDILLVVLILAMMAVSMLFISLAAAFAIGAWLGSNALGFLIVGVVFGLLAVSIRSSRVDLATKVGRTLTRSGRDVTAESIANPPVPALTDKGEERNG